MKVSVRIITYNHAAFIRQALDGVLMQQTNFDYEIVIGEDDSSDGTREIVKEYEAKYPDKIRLLLNDRKNVIRINGKPTGRWNFINTLKHCRGQYIALLDGDDYWTSPHKLQKQADFLDQNPGCAFCFHEVEVVDDQGARCGESDAIKIKKPIYDLHDLLEGKFAAPTGSVVYRNGLFKEFPEWFVKVFIADLPLHILNAQHGNIGFIDEVMGAYRRHAGGIWTQGVRTKNWSSQVLGSTSRGMLHLFETIDRHFNGQYHAVLAPRISNLCYDLVWASCLEQNWKDMRMFLLKALRAKPFVSQVSMAFILKSYAIAFCPPGYKVFKLTRDKLFRRTEHA